MRTCVLMSAACLVFAAAPAAAQEGKRYAVLVGVNDYQHPKLEALKYAVNDAAELAAVLEKAGYAVTLLTDDAGKKDPKLAPTKANVEGALKAVAGGCKKGDLLLVGLAGHGLQFEGDADAYFCPSDGRPFKKEADTLVSLKAVYEGLDGSFAGMKVLLVDACRDDPAAGRGIGADTAPKPPQGVAALFSCKAGQQAFEAKEYKHGVFFYHVLTGLRGEAADKKGRVTFAGLAAHVGMEVPGDVARLKKGGASQTPNLVASYTSEPVLVAKAVAGGGAATDDERIAADFRAYERARDQGLMHKFFQTEAPRQLEVWRKGAEKGNPVAQTLFAHTVARGTGVKASRKESFAWFKKAADAGVPEAMCQVAFAHRAGWIVDQDFAETFRWSKKAADLGYPPGMVELGLCYETARGAAKDSAEGVKWFRKAADAGHPSGMMNMARGYEFGRGVEKDDAEAAKWYRKAADAGNAYGLAYVGQMYALGKGVPRDEATALEWFRKAAEAGNPDGMATLGHRYNSGFGAPKDEAEAVKWFKRAADIGSPSGMDALASAYAKGRGVAKDENEAARWTRKAAEAGDMNGMLRLGQAYETGSGVEKDAAEAVKWYKKAAEVGHLGAALKLGDRYANGQGVEKDEREAVRWFREAAENGYDAGMFLLAGMYETGRGVEKDTAEAVRWYRKAADRGHPLARDALKRLGAESAPKGPVIGPAPSVAGAGAGRFAST